MPQGSILGLLLFLIYLNDITQVSNELEYILFADDTSLFLSGQDLTQLVIKFNYELNQINKWFVVNKLVLNVKKTNFMIFTNRKIDDGNIDIRINNNSINRCNSLKFLGIHIDCKMSWREHIDSICYKLSKVIGILNRLKHFPSHILLMIYNALFLPYVNYCNIAWANSRNYHIMRLFKLQKKVIRIISSSPYLAHTNPLFKQLKLLTIFELNEYNIAIFMFLCSKGAIPERLSKHFIKNSLIHSYGTRQASYYHTPQVRTNISKNSIFFRGPEIWNNLDISIRESPSLNTFKRRLRQLYFT